MAGDFPEVIWFAQAATPPAAEAEHAAPLDGEALAPAGEAEHAPAAEGELHSSTGEAEHSGPPEVFPPFDSSTFGSQLLWLAITFGALYLLMSKVALPRIGEILETRRDRIESDLAEAERLRQRTDKAIQSYEEALAEARRRAHEIAAKTRDDIRADLDGKRGKVEADLGARLSAAEKSIQDTKQAALANVEEIATDTATTLVSQLLGRVPAKSIKDAVRAAAKGE